MQTNKVDIQHHHSDKPILSILFGAISWFINMADFSHADQAILAPLAHTAAFGSGLVAIILGLISIKEKADKYIKK
jgi:hypothetical protein